MDTQKVMRKFGINLTRILSAGATLTSMNMLSTSLKEGGNENADNIVLGIAATVVVAGSYALTMDSVNESEYTTAAVEGATTAAGLITVHKSVNMNSMPKVQKDADGNEVPTGPAKLKLQYGLASPQIPTMADFGMQSPNVTDVEESNEYAAVSGMNPMAAGL